MRAELHVVHVRHLLRHELLRDRRVVRRQRRDSDLPLRQRSGVLRHHDMCSGRPGAGRRRHLRHHLLWRRHAVPALKTPIQAPRTFGAT